MKKIQLFLSKPIIKNIIAPVLRGAIQTIPGGGIAVQAARNISHEISEEKKEEKPPHNYISIAIQVIGIAAICLAFFNGKITPDKLLELLYYFK